MNSLFCPTDRDENAVGKVTQATVSAPLQGLRIKNRLGFPNPGRWPISVNLSETVSAPLARRLSQGMADFSPLAEHRGQTLGQQQGRSYLTVHEFNLSPPTATGLPRHSPRGKMFRRCA